MLIKSNMLEEGLKIPSEMPPQEEENEISLMERCCSGVKKSDKYAKGRGGGDLIPSPRPFPVNGGATRVHALTHAVRTEN